MSFSLLSVSVDCGDAVTHTGRVLVAGARTGGRRRRQRGLLQHRDAGRRGRRPGLPVHLVPDGKTAKNRLHVDFAAADLAEEVDRVVIMGGPGSARRPRRLPGVTLADIEGNGFDIVAAP